jgi:hypothetical protein
MVIMGSVTEADGRQRVRFVVTPDDKQTGAENNAEKQSEHKASVELIIKAALKKQRLPYRPSS